MIKRVLVYLCTNVGFLLACAGGAACVATLGAAFGFWAETRNGIGRGALAGVLPGLFLGAALYLWCVGLNGFRRLRVLLALVPGLKVPDVTEVDPRKFRAGASAFTGAIAVFCLAGAALATALHLTEDQEFAAILLSSTFGPALGCIVGSCASHFFAPRHLGRFWALLGVTGLCLFGAILSIHFLQSGKQSRAVQTLLPHLKAGSLGERREAATQLAKLGPAAHAAFPALAEALRDDDSEVRHNAARSLRLITLSYGNPPLLQWAMPWLRYPLTRRAHPLIPDLVATMKGGSTLRDIVELLGHIGPPAAVAVAALCRDPDRATRLRALDTLKQFDQSAPQVAVPPLVEALRDDDRDVRYQAALSLSTYRNEDALPVLMTAIKDRDYRGRESAIRSLSRYGGQASSAIEELETIVANPDELRKLRDAASSTLLYLRR